jgi:hypothetical protein
MKSQEVAEGALKRVSNGDAAESGSDLEEKGA